MPIPGASPCWIVCCATKPLSVFFCPSKIQQRDILFEPPNLPPSSLAKKKTLRDVTAHAHKDKKAGSIPAAGGGEIKRVLAVQEGLSVFLSTVYSFTALWHLSPATPSTRFSTGLTANNYLSPALKLLFLIHSCLWVHKNFDCIFLLVLGLLSFPVSFYILHISDNTGQIWMTLASVSNKKSFSPKCWEECCTWYGNMWNAIIFCMSSTLDQAVLSHDEFCPVSFWSHKLPSTLSWEG